MARDIRHLFENTPEEVTKPPQGHQARFEARLDEAFGNTTKQPHQSTIQFMWLKIAAVAIVLVSIGVFGYKQLSSTPNSVEVVEVPKQTENANEQIAKITLGDLSPDLKKVENYYLTGINVQLASLNIKDDNKELVDGYMQQLSELDKEYKRLTVDLNEVGPTEATVTALIDNLQLRLELLFKLKNKLKELKNQKDETTTII